jgi:hypothetical protein
MKSLRGRSPRPPSVTLPHALPPLVENDVQIFLPYPDFAWTARVLEERRPGKQRVEVLQICNALHRDTGGWVDHPVSRTWRGYGPAWVACGIAAQNLPYVWRA